MKVFDSRDSKWSRIHFPRYRSVIPTDKGSREHFESFAEFPVYIITEKRRIMYTCIYCILLDCFQPVISTFKGIEDSVIILEIGCTGCVKNRVNPVIGRSCRPFSGEVSCKNNGVGSSFFRSIFHIVKNEDLTPLSWEQFGIRVEFFPD